MTNWAVILAFASHIITR